MATTTPNIGLTKPVGTEFVNLSIINENYDKIDEAVGQINEAIEQTNEDVDHNTTEVAKLTETFKIGTFLFIVQKAFQNQTLA